MDINLLGKRYVELEPTITIASDTLLAEFIETPTIPPIEEPQKLRFCRLIQEVF